MEAPGTAPGSVTPIPGRVHHHLRKHSGEKDVHKNQENLKTRQTASWRQIDDTKSEPGHLHMKNIIAAISLR